MEWSFLPPFAGLKQTRSQAGLLAYGIIRPTRHAFPFDVNSGLRVAFVADYSCEGSGGFAPRFPSTCGVPGCQCGLTEALVCFRAECHCWHNSEPRAHDPQSAGFCKDANIEVRVAALQKKERATESDDTPSSLSQRQTVTSHAAVRID
jgi:hypothetical protein